MDIRKFYKESIKTCAPPELALNRVKENPLLLVELFSLLKDISIKCDKLDVLKKEIFYGKYNRRSLLKRIYWKFRSFFYRIRIDKKNINNIDMDLLHGIVGLVGEAGGELIHAYLSGFESKNYDKVNIIEELGDSFWYFSPIVRSLDISPEEPFYKVIEKLRVRYKNSNFSEKNAIHRDLNKERKTLEQQGNSKKTTKEKKT